VVNRLEASDILGTEHLSAREMVEDLAARALSANIIVTLGEDGVAFAEPGGEVRRAAARKVAVRSTHGAGDMFTGSLAAARLAGADLAEAVAFAQARAADLVARDR
jgi:ribokinase